MFPDEEEIARERREEIKLPLLLIAMIILFIAGVFCGLLGLAIILLHRATQPQGATTPASGIAGVVAPCLSDVTFCSHYNTESSFGTTTLTLDKTNRTSMYNSETHLSNSLIRVLFRQAGLT